MSQPINKKNGDRSSSRNMGAGTGHRTKLCAVSFLGSHSTVFLIHPLPTCLGVALPSVHKVYLSRDGTTFSGLGLPANGWHYLQWVGSNCLGMALPSVDWVHLYHLAIRKVTHRHYHKPIWGRHFFNISLMRQVDNQNQPSQRPKHYWKHFFNYISEHQCFWDRVSFHWWIHFMPPFSIFPYMSPIFT